MGIPADKDIDNKSKSVANAVSQEQSKDASTFQFIDNRPEFVANRKLQERANNSPRAKKASQLRAMINNNSRQQHPLQQKENNTGLPDNLKTGMENLSGYSMDDVKVHRNSDKPAQLQAHAYAQGTEIHLGAGQEKYLPHEAWHVVQQKQGRVKPTMQMKGKVNVNDDAGLEKEAVVMGAKALQMKKDSRIYHFNDKKSNIIQRVLNLDGKESDNKTNKKFFNEIKNSLKEPYREVYDQMSSSDSKLVYKSKSEIFFDVIMRVSKVEIAREIIKLGTISFTPDAIMMKEANLWVPISEDERVWGIKKGGSPTDAVEQLLDSKIAIECAAAIQLIELSAILKTMQELEIEELFDRHFSDISIGFAGVSSDDGSGRESGEYKAQNSGADATRKIESYDDLIPGDQVYFANNPEYEKLNPEGDWMGENALYLGPDEFYGHGVGISTSKKIIMGLNDQFIAEGGDKKKQKTAETIEGSYPGLISTVTGTTQINI